MHAHTFLSQVLLDDLNITPRSVMSQSLFCACIVQCIFLYVQFAGVLFFQLYSFLE
jgi:hypothetical protein